MGGCFSSSKSNYIPSNDGSEEDFYNLYLEDGLLGEGEFGQVKLVHNMKTSQVCAVKILRKGIVFRDNVVYAPLKPNVLRAEVEMLRCLNGKHYCLALFGVYETQKLIYLVTELCGGGPLFEYVSKRQDLRVHDVSRIVFQVLDALHHCASQYILHRDVKPDNVLFVDNEPDSDLRLIDFGSGCMDDGPSPPIVHTTFAGSAFYVSPELFQRTYTSKTDVWSCGALLYVLVAGYPADDLQKAFNLMHKSRNRDLKLLPNLPHDMPPSFYDLLEELLAYRHKARKSAGELLQHEFVQLHKQEQHAEAGSPVENGATTGAGASLSQHHADQQQHHDGSLTIQEVVADSLSPLMADNSNAGDSLSSKQANRTTSSSIRLTSSVKRHSLFMDFKRFERSVTTLLATLLSKQDFNRLLEQVSKRNTTMEPEAAVSEQDAIGTTSNEGRSSDDDGGRVQQQHQKQQQGGLVVTKQLNIIPISELKVILKEMGAQKCLDKISQLQNAANYESFAYHVDLLAQFQRETVILSNSSMYDDGGPAGGGLERRHSFSGAQQHDDQQTTNSVHGSDVYKNMKKRHFGRSGGASSSKGKGDNLSNSWHLGQSSGGSRTSR